MFVCDPFHTLEDREGQGGMRRVAGRPAGVGPPLRVTGRWGSVGEEAGDSAGDPGGLGQVVWSRRLQLQPKQKGH